MATGIKTDRKVIGQITKGKHKGALARPCYDSMDCPFFRGANDEEVSIVYITDNGEYGLIVAVKANEIKWL